ncbi:MAG: hypothetical protein ABW074_03785 [Sedimenticola sp.]
MHKETVVASMSIDGVRLDYPWATEGFEKDPQIAPVGTEGDFVVAYVGGRGDRLAGQTIYVQKFDKHGNPVGDQIGSNIDHWPGAEVVPMIYIRKEARDPQVTAVGEEGAFVLAYSSNDEDFDRTVVVQRFDPEGKPTGEQTRLEVAGVRDGSAGHPEIVALGPGGDFAVAFVGRDRGGDQSIFVQRFDALGGLVGNQTKLEATGVTDGWDGRTELAAVGSDGSFVVTYVGAADSHSREYSVYVQRFDALGRPQGAQVELETGVIGGWYSRPQISAVGSDGDYVITYAGEDSGGDSSVYLQKFDAIGEPAEPIMLEGYGVTDEWEGDPEVTAIGTDGAFAVAYTGKMQDGDDAVIVQRFDSRGEPVGNQYQIKVPGAVNGWLEELQIRQTGTDGAFVVSYIADGGCHQNDHEMAFVNGLYPGDQFENFLVVHRFDENGLYVGTDIKQHIPSCSFDDRLVDVTPIGGEGAYAAAYVAKSEEGGSSVFVDTFGVPVPDVPVYDPALVSGLNTTSNDEFTVATSEEESRILFKSKGVNWTGSFKDEIVVSDWGDDYLIGNGGYDLIDAGGGDDTIILNGDNIAKLEEGVFAPEPAHIDGGAGSDRLMLIDASLDFTALADDRIVDIEIFDLKTDSGVNELTITEQAVNNLLGDENGAIRIKGRGGDLVHAEGFSDSGVDRVYEGTHYDVYTLNSATLWIDQAIAHVVV